MNIISMDFGTSSLKLSVIDEKLNLIESVKEDYSYKIAEPEFVEIEPQHIISALTKALKNLSFDLRKIEGICYDTFSPSVVFMDTNGDPLYPIITHLDRRSKEESDFIREKIGIEDFMEITGILPFIGGTSITTVLWMKKHYPEIYEKSNLIGHLNTYLHRFLTGLLSTDTVNASMTGMYDTIGRKGWAKDLIHDVGLTAAKLPIINTPGILLGNLINHELISLGLKRGIPVSIGTNDIASAQFGADNDQTGDVLMVSGSSDMISILTDKALINKSYYLRASVNNNLWQIFGITTSGFALEWVRSQFFSEFDIDSFYSKIINKALSAGPRDVVYLPYITGDRHSLEVRKGAFEGIDLSTTRYNLLSAMIHGIHDPIGNILAIVENDNSLKRTIKLTGGLCSNQALVSFKENIFNDYKFEVLQDCPIKGNAKMFFKFSKS